MFILIFLFSAYRKFLVFNLSVCKKVILDYPKYLEDIQKRKERRKIEVYRKKFAYKKI